MAYKTFGYDLDIWNLKAYNFVWNSNKNQEIHENLGISVENTVEKR